MKVKILVGAGWYKDMVGETVEVQAETTLFRSSETNRRVKHYVATGTVVNPNNGMIGTRFVQCTHAQPVKG